MKKIPFVSFDDLHAPLKQELLQAVNDVIEQGDFILGSKVGDFEKAYAAYSGTKHAIGVSNGLDALKICLKAVGIGSGDEVIVPAHTFIATVFAVLEVCAVPVLVEPDETTFNITAADIEKALTPKTKAIMPVHLYGQACDMQPIMELAHRHGLKVIEDNAQAQGAIYQGKHTGSFGYINASSFYPAKNLGAFGDAGIITTDDDELARKAHLYRNVGSEKKYHHEVQGYNARMDAMQAAILSIKLRHLDDWNKERQRMALLYLNLLKDCRSIVLPTVNDMNGHVFHLFVIRSERRDALQQYLAEQGISSMIHYPVANHLQPALHYLGYRPGDLPITESIAATCLSLPLYIGLSNGDIAYVADKIIQFK